MCPQRLTALGVCFLWLFGCAGTSSGGGTQTNWVNCRTDEDCLGSQICVEEVCRDRPALDAGQRDSRTPDAPGSGTAWLPPPGPYNCERHVEPTTFAQGDGQCAPPPITAPMYCTNTCADQPGAPGPEDCPPSVIEEFARCCYPGGCGYDDGNECRSFVDLTDETVASALPCAASSTTPERIYEGLFDRVVLTQDSIVIGTFRGNDAASVTYVAKDTCAATEVYSMANVWDLTATDEAAYVIGYDAATSESPILAVSPTGVVTKVPLAELFDPYAIDPVNLVTSGTSVYVVARVDSEADATSVFGIAEIPCCGSPPRVVADDLTQWQSILDSAVMTNAAMEGQTLVLAGYDATLDASRGRIAGVFDFNTNQGTLFFDFFHGSMNPFAVADGRLYLVSDDRIVTMDTADCSLTTVTTRPAANGITALAVDGGDVFWAETYSNVAGARIFVKRMDGTETRLAEVHDNVDWIGVDSQNVYWSMQPVATPSKALVRRRRP
jgi:hypothetical protein